MSTSFNSAFYFLFICHFGFASTNPVALTIPNDSAGSSVKNISGIDSKTEKSLSPLTESLGKKFFERIDLSTPGLEKVHEKAVRGEFQAALDAYRTVLLNDLKKRPAAELGKHWGNSDANELMNGIARISRHSGGISKNRIGLPGQIEWTKPTVDEIVNEPPDIEAKSRESSNRDWTTHLSSMHHVACLVRTFKVSHDPKYAAFWLETWGDFAERHKELVRKADPKQYNSIGGCWRSVLFVAWRMENFWIGLQEIATALPEDQYSCLNSTTLARALISMFDDHGLFQEDCLLNSAGVPNQFAETAKALMRQALYFKGGKRAAEWTKISRDFTLKYYAQINLPDGTNLEQAINYNKGNMNLAIEVIRISGQESIEWLKPALKNATATLRYIASMIRNGTHHGAIPRMGQDDRSEEELLGNALKYLPDEDTNQIINHVYGDGTASQPSFTSRAFPYSGYFVMRTGWKKEDAYSFFKASRRPRGHARNDNTAIHFICAYGRDLLIDQGSPTYGEHEINPLLSSSFSKNTIQVDGFGQDLKPIGKGTRGDETTSDCPIQNRWHTSNRFDFAEGFYHGGYENPTILVRHERQIFFLRKQQIWIVTDRMRGESTKMPAEESHLYSQTWNFPENFEEKQVTINLAKKSIQTIDPMGANVSIHHFNAFPMDYKKYYGQEKPLRGWVRVTGIKPLKAVSIDSNWQGKGEQVLVTLIIPANKGEEQIKSLNPINIAPDGSTCGFSLVLKEGTSINYSAALNSADLKVNSLTVQGSSLLLVTPPGKPTGGIILDGVKSLLNGNDLPLPKPDFEFTLQNQKIEDVNPILYPSALTK